MVRSALALTAVVVTALALAGCASNGHASSSTSNPGSTTAGSSSGPASNARIESTATTQSLERVLLAASDVTPTATAAKASIVDKPLPCAADGSPSLNQQVPAILRSGVDISDDNGRTAVSEEIRVYRDIATAVHALSTAKDGLTCTNGVLRADDGTKLNVALSGPNDILTDLKRDPKLTEVPIGRALTWAAHSTHGEQFVLVAAQIDATLLLMDFAAATTADESKLPDPEVLIEKAIEKANT